MKIAVGSDHAGFDLKEHLKSHLSTRGIETTDFGTSGTESVDYPDFAFDVARAVAQGDCDYGVLVCSTGVGMSIAANKVEGIRAALAYNSDVAAQSRAHLDANVLVFGQRFTETGKATAMLDVWLDTSFEGGRHERRVNKIKAFEAHE
jgi:ribose 5-phosphate isomerase B